MRREDIPWRLAAARGATIARIPAATLATMAPCDLAPRLLAHDALIRKARVPHLDADLYRHRIRMASDALTETDPRRVAAIMKAAGVPWSGHEPMTGTHTHAHPAYGSQGADATHEHEHTHRGDANHRHSHASAKSAKSAAQLVVDAARAAAQRAVSAPARPTVSGALTKAAVTAFPAVDVLVRKATAAQSVSVALIAMADEGRLGDLERDIGLLRRAALSGVELVRRPLA